MFTLFWTTLGSLIGPLVISVMKFVGISLVSYVGIDTFFSFLLSDLKSNMGGLPSGLLNMFALFGIDEVITIYLSSASSAFALKASTKSIGA